MKEIIRITRISAKESFFNLRENGPYFCTELDKNVEITNLYLRHISGKSKNRKTKEIILRLLIIPLVGRILKKGLLIQVRKYVKIEGELYIKSFKISLRIGSSLFSLIIAEKEKNELILISSFIDFLNAKKDPSGSDPS